MNSEIACKRIPHGELEAWMDRGDALRKENDRLVENRKT